jgi:hypothetical protein
LDVQIGTGLRNNGNKNKGKGGDEETKRCFFVASSREKFQIISEGPDPRRRAEKWRMHEQGEKGLSAFAKPSFIWRLIDLG